MVLHCLRLNRGLSSVFLSPLPQGATKDSAAFCVSPKSLVLSPLRSRLPATPINPAPLPSAFRSGQIWENRLYRWMHQLVVGDI
jgi:hypothetical protein